MSVHARRSRGTLRGRLIRVRIRTGSRRGRIELFAVCGNAAAVRAVAVVLHIGPDLYFHFLLNELAVAVIGREQQGRDARLLRGQASGQSAAAGRRHEVRRRARLNRIVHDRVRRIHRIRECRRHRGRGIAHVEYLVRKVKLRHVIVTRIHIGKIKLSRRNVCHHRDRCKICIPVKARTHTRITALIFFNQLPRRRYPRAVCPDRPVAFVRNVEIVIS